MRIALVMPPVALGKPAVERMLASLGLHFGADAEISLHAPAESLDAYAQALPGKPFALYDRGRVLESSDVAVLANGPQGGRADEPGGLSRLRVYSLADGARLRLENSGLDTREYPHLEAHAFNRLSPRSPDGYFYYFPWAYLFRYTGWGPLDAFGFRVPEDLRPVAARPANHKLVAVFGGSAAWSMYCLHNEMFSARLEAMLNEACREAGLDTRYTVLNFGMHGHVLLNQIITYTLFVEQLRPDVVISHDGFNDLGYGQLSDSYLLRRGITFQTNLEDWATILHQSDPGLKTHTDSPYKARNLHPAVVKAYVDRKRQFMRMVESNGARFLWGLQPFVESKAAPCPEEAGYLAAELELVRDRPFSIMYRNQRILFSLAQKAVAKAADPAAVVDTHEAFQAYGADAHLFGDFVHTLPEGDTAIARCYMEYFKNHL